MRKTNKSGRSVKKPNKGAGFPSTVEGAISGHNRDNAPTRTKPDKLKL